jgi:hypothetical protein
LLKALWSIKLLKRKTSNAEAIKVSALADIMLAQ